jgi:hypothetical protein
MNRLKHIGILIVLVFVSLGGFTQLNVPNGSTIPTATAVATSAAFSSGVKINYVRTHEAVAPISNNAIFDTANYLRVKQATQYIDGLGRSIQTVIKQASPALKDLVSPVTYDSFGRESYKYLPYISADSNGHFKLDAFGAQATFMASQYPGESIFYAETKFEKSPLSRIIKSFAPGNSWGGNDKGISMEYKINEVSDSVRIWNIPSDTLLYTLADTLTNIPTSTAKYGAGQLYETHTMDEQGKEVVEYKDKEGKVILKKVQISGSPSAEHSGWLCTYYVYDDFGLLSFVIRQKQPNGSAHNWVLTSAVAAELCFRYEYDDRNRMIGKKVPGAGWVYMVYDKRDRLVFTQDANMRGN